MLALGLAAAVALAAAQYLSPASKALMQGRDVRLALLGDNGSALLVYRPAAGSVNAFTFSRPRRKSKATGWQRALDLYAQAGAAGSPEDVFFVSVSSAPDLEAFLGALNGWRAEPRRFFAAARWGAALARSGGTNISAFDLFSLFSDFSGLNASNFFVAESAKQETDAGDPGDDDSPAPRVEVFNASGRKDLAAAAAVYLRGQGFDVITASSYARTEARTRILGFSKDTSAALKLRAALDLEELEIHVSPAQKSVGEAAVILGADFDVRVLGRPAKGAAGVVPGVKN
jgi:hypothetical protein